MSRTNDLQAAWPRRVDGLGNVLPHTVPQETLDGLLAVVRAAQAALDHADDDCAHWPELDILRAALDAFEEGKL